MALIAGESFATDASAVELAGETGTSGMTKPVAEPLRTVSPVAVPLPAEGDEATDWPGDGNE